MKLINTLVGDVLGLFQKKDDRKERMEKLMRKAGRYAILRWSPAAHTLGVDQKMIYIFYQGYLQDSFLSSPARLSQLEEEETPIIDDTAGSEYPDEYIRPGSKEIIMSRVRLGWI